MLPTCDVDVAHVRRMDYVPFSSTAYLWCFNTDAFKTVLFVLNKMINMIAVQDPVVQSIVSLTISLRHKFVKQISAKVTNTLLFFVEKM